MSHTIRIALSTGEPAGIGPDLAVIASQKNYPFELVCIGDIALLQQRAKNLKIEIKIKTFSKSASPSPSIAGELTVLPITTAKPVTAGQLDIGNADYVMSILDKAISLCQNNTCQAMVTNPIQKSTLIEGGYNIQGHTEYLAEKTETNKVVMMLASDEMKVALATTHLPLSKVSEAITKESLDKTIRILHKDLENKFGITSPKIAVCGLNPHAGENGHMGHEEQSTIIPCLEKLKADGFQLEGPLPADTIFTQEKIKKFDAILAMYHDQGLPALKYQSFGKAVNITLGLPIIRTSVDHGTALDLAGSGQIDDGSLNHAISMAFSLAKNTTNSSIN